MIHYQLRCIAAHEFDAWFRDSATFEAQAATGLLECPRCGESQITRALMAPSLPRGRSAESNPAKPAPLSTGTAAGPTKDLALGERVERLPDYLRATLQRMRGEVERRCDYVGANFADEARKINEGESRPRGIYGEATRQEAEALAEDGIEVSRIPWLPRADA